METGNQESPEKEAGAITIFGLHLSGWVIANQESIDRFVEETLSNVDTEFSGSYYNGTEF